MNQSSILIKIRHFLLQQSDIYKESLKDEAQDINVSKIAKELNKKMGLGERRLKRYLSEDTSPKELSVTLDDMVAFSRVADETVVDFLSYLTGECSITSLSHWQKDVIDFFDSLNLNKRRLLNCTLFDKIYREKSCELLELSARAIDLNYFEIEQLKRYIMFLKYQRDDPNLPAIHRDSLNKERGFQP